MDLKTCLILPLELVRQVRVKLVTIIKYNGEIFCQGMVHIKSTGKSASCNYLSVR